ncbi:MAG TPA: hypothetical protein DCE56_44685 [Cyanobacteria bacterium UBA8553]|nr:hypothetical protein [Cyanobacteria bacterium UBA8553]HAJ64045.1 hypothetical protein [Cyanobacteria bacterium UBA8543]
MQNPPTDRYTPPRSTNTYSASVPISVYRELAGELHAAQAMLESLKAQNQQLVKQNQQLRQEVEKVVQSAQHLQQIVGSFGSVSGNQTPQSRPFTPPEPRPTPPPAAPRPAASAPAVEFPPPPQDPEPEFSPYNETLVIEQEEPRSRHSSHSEGFPEVNGWLLLTAILMIVLFAFGTGFLIVRPLLKSR